MNDSFGTRRELGLDDSSRSLGNGGTFTWRRAQAALTAGVLALGSLAPATTLAAGNEAGASALAENPDDAPDLGSPTDDLEDAGEAAPSQEPDADKTLPEGPASTPSPPDIEPEHTAGPDPGDLPDLSLDPSDPAPASPAADIAEQPRAAVAPDASSPAQAVPTSDVPAPGAVTPMRIESQTPTGHAERHAASAAQARSRAQARVLRSERRARRAVRIVVATPPAAALPTVRVSAPPTPRAVPPAPRAASLPSRRADAANRGMGARVVQRGESLWSIAADVLGDDATPGQIAREVTRLWDLNRTRIGTGDPNLLIAGTRLNV